MSNRRRRRRRAPAEVPPQPLSTTKEGTGTGERGGWFRRILAPRQPTVSPFPPLGESIRRGALAAGSSAAVLTVAFLGLLALWGGFNLLDAALSAQGMVYVMGLPPVHVPLDVGVVQSLIRVSSTLALASVVALGVVRGLILGSMALLVHGAVRGKADPRAALRRLPRVAVTVFGIYGAEVGLFLFLLLFVQSLLGPAAVLVILVLGLHFLGFAPVVAAAERVPAGAALRIGFRASRLPGARHLTLVVLYFAVVLYAGVGATAAAGESSPATPSLLTWGVALLATFGHVAVLGALAYRWDAVREHVLAEDTRREAARRAARGRGRGRRSGPAKASSGGPSEKRDSRSASSRAVAGKDSAKATGKTSEKPSGKGKGGKAGRRDRGTRKGGRR
ncbi:MAG: hypothetical protein ACRDIX_01370 [Actinomycetota bacterium]